MLGSKFRVGKIHLKLGRVRLDIRRLGTVRLDKLRFGTVK